MHLILFFFSILYSSITNMARIDVMYSAKNRRKHSSYLCDVIDSCNNNDENVENVSRIFLYSSTVVLLQPGNIGLLGGKEDV